MKFREQRNILSNDLRYSIRVLTKSPGFVLVAILTLALGVGAITAMFSVVNAVLLRPLPYPQPGQLVRLARAADQEAITLWEYKYWKEHSHAFSAMAGYRGANDRHLVVGDHQEWIKAMAVTSDFLRTLRINPLIGREFNSLEEHAGGLQPVLLTHHLWQAVFNGESAVLGRTIRLDNAGYVVVGVLPKEFWFPQAIDALVAIQSTGGVEDSGTNTSVIARISDDANLKRAQADSATVTESFRSDYVGRISVKYRGVIVVAYQEWLVGKIRTDLLLLFGTTAFLLLIVCSNLTSLFLTRLAAREREIAVRLALGSNNRRLLRQFLIENVLLSFMGIITGLILAKIILGGLLALLPFHLPTSSPITLDKTVLTFAAGVFFALALSLTLVLAFNLGRLNVHDALKSIGQVAGTQSVQQRIRHLLVVGQVALSAMLLATAGLLIQSLYHLHREQLGFKSAGLITFSTSLAPDRYPDAASASRFANTISDRISALPGVLGVGAINLLPLTGNINLPAEQEGHPDHSIGGMEIRLVTPDYFKIMAIPLKQGRPFLPDDSATATPVAIVNETVARLWRPNRTALSGRVIIGRYQQQDYPEIRDAPREIVGIVGDTKTVNLRESPRPTVFLPLPQAKDVFVGMTGKLAWIVRSDNPTGVPEQLRRVISEFDPAQNIQRLETMNEVVESTTANSRFDAWLFGGFATLALVLAAVGVYSVLSFSVAYRRQEIGTRMALGATRASVLALILKEGLFVVAAGLGLGLIGAVLLMRSLASLLYAIRPNDPFNFFLVSVILMLTGLIASYIPSSRATKIDPLVALRYE